jgi:hypothetical protein
MITACRHFVNDQQVPCPPMCPCQEWPRSHFRYRFVLFGRLIPKGKA